MQRFVGHALYDVLVRVWMIDYFCSCYFDVCVFDVYLV